MLEIIYPALSDGFYNKYGWRTRQIVEPLLNRTMRSGLLTLAGGLAGVGDVDRTKFVNLLADQARQANRSDTTVRQTGSHFSPWNFHWLAFYDFASRYVDGYDPSESVENFAHWFYLFAGAFSFAFFENFVFVCRHPRTILRADSSRFHNAVGPAIEFEDGTNFYLWKGTMIRKQMIEERHKLTPAKIDSNRNVSIKEILIDIYGFEKYIRKSKLQLISTDRYGRLYRKSIGIFRHEALTVVEVTNATREPDGSFRRYFLRVPDHMKTAHQAVAWTFNMTEAEYVIEEET